MKSSVTVEIRITITIQLRDEGSKEILIQRFGHHLQTPPAKPSISHEASPIIDAVGALEEGDYGRHDFTSIFPAPTSYYPLFGPW